MNKAILSAQWGYFRMVLGVTRKLVDQIPEDKLDFRPVPEVRSAQELAAHMYNFLTEAVDTVAAGKHMPSEEKPFASKAALLAWMDSQVEKAFAKFETLTDAQLAAKLVVWGETFHGWQILDFTYQEALHHRGQLTVYLRLMGIKPVFVYDMA